MTRDQGFIYEDAVQTRISVIHSLAEEWRTTHAPVPTTLRRQRRRTKVQACMASGKAFNIKYGIAAVVTSRARANTIASAHIYWLLSSPMPRSIENPAHNHTCRERREQAAVCW